MLLVRKRVLAVVLTLLLSLPLGAALWAFSFTGLAGEELRFSLETLLFTAICLVSILGFAAAFWLFRLRDIDDSLDRINRQGAADSEAKAAGLQRLGETGRRIGQLFRSSELVSEKRAQKVSALSALASALTSEIEIPLIAAGMDGRLIHGSRAAALGEKDITDVESFFDGKNINEILLDMLKRQDSDFTAVDGKIYSAKLIKSRDGNPAYIIFRQK